MDSGRVWIPDCSLRRGRWKGLAVKPLILIIDDDSVFRSDLILVLENDYRCREAESLATAISEVEHEEPDVIILDFNLGANEDGFHVLEILKTMDPNIPVIMMTSQPSISMVVEAVRRGVFSFLSKTSDLRELRATLIKAIEWREIQKS